MSAPQVSNAFIDLFASQTEPEGRLSTYGELEKRLYSVGPSNRVKNRKIILFIMLIIFLIYIKG